MSVTLLASCSTGPIPDLKERQTAQKEFDLGHYEASEKMLVQAVEDLELQKQKSEQLPDALQQLALVYLLDGKYTECEKTAGKAQALHEKAEHKNANALILDAYELASIDTKMGNFAAAETILKDAIVSRKSEIEGKRKAEIIDGVVPSPRLAALESALGTTYFEAGRYQEAETELKEAIQLAEADSASKEPDAIPILANALQEAARVYQVDGKFQDAEVVCKNGMRMLRDAVGMHHPYFISAANNLITIYCDQHKYGRCADMIRSLAQTERETLRKDHPEVTRSGMLNVISVYHNHRERSPEEPRILFQALTGQDAAIFGEESPQVANDFLQAGEYELSTGDYAAAEPKLRTALSISRVKLGDKHPKTIHSLNSLAMALGLKGITTKTPATLGEASKLAGEAVKHGEETLPEESPDRCRSLGILASVEAVSEHYDESYRLFHLYLDAAKKSTYEEPGERMRFLRNYINVLNKLGRQQEGEQYTHHLVSATGQQP